MSLFFTILTIILTVLVLIQCEIDEIKTAQYIERRDRIYKKRWWKY